MDEQQYHFTPESVDEQLEQLSREREHNTEPAADTDDARLVQDLRRTYRSQSNMHQYTLDSAWQRIVAQKLAVDQETTEESLPLQDVQPGNIISPFPTSQIRKKSFQQRLTMIAAVIIACLMIGSTWAVLNVARQSEETAGTATSTVQPESSPTGIPQKIGTTLYTHPESSAVRSVDWLPHGMRILSTGKKVQIWDALTGSNELTHDPREEAQYFSSRWSPDGKLVATGVPVLEIWDATTGKSLRTCSAPYSSITQTTQSSQNSLFSSMGNPQAIRSLSAHLSMDVYGDEEDTLPEAIAWSPDGKYIALTYRDEVPGVVVYEVANCRQVHFFSEPNDVPYDVAWSPNGKYLAYSDSDNRVKVIDVATEETIAEYKNEPYNTAIYHVTWSPDSKRIASTSSGSHTVEVWDAMSGKRGVVYEGPQQPVTALAWSPDGKYIATGSSYGSDESKLLGEVHIWNPDNGSLLHIYREHKQPVLALSWSPDSKYIASADGERSNPQHQSEVRIWRAQP